MVLFEKATFIPSPHYDARPESESIDLLVIHNISLPPSQFGTSGIRDLFTGKLDPDGHPFYKEIAGLRVSAHCVIYRTGEIEQFVPFEHRAWHAGVSCFQGRHRCNDYSIGIELEGTDSLPYTDAQYDALKQVCEFIIKRYPRITLGRIVGHNDIAPGRKTDPGHAFDWARFRTGLKHVLGAR
ncbi:1,6-anhydro-N-acetylmuramyl-L-alanine amidase AmpD [Alteromonas sp. D210916BOD_24]|uniref:1,6-anhydro-N-acetylmuramyl-L-alanine amidase AmpD n=1 Tax=Alteromonas sp. D210916BOD_24 TaxID=3157618 RepID=UPI00399C9426